MADSSHNFHVGGKTLQRIELSLAVVQKRDALFTDRDRVIPTAELHHPLRPGVADTHFENQTFFARALFAFGIFQLHRSYSHRDKPHPNVAPLNSLLTGIDPISWCM